MVGWLSGFQAQTGSVAYWSYATFVRRLGESAAPWGRECVPFPDFASNTLAFALQLRKITENFRIAGGLIITERDSFSRLGHRGRWPRMASLPCRTWLSRQATGSALGQLKYLPNCRTRAFHTSANFESKLSFRTLMWSANSGTPRSSCICLLRTKGRQ